MNVTPTDEFKKSLNIVGDKIEQTNQLIDPEEGQPLQVSASENFNESLSMISEKINDTNEILDPRGHKRRKSSQLGVRNRQQVNALLKAGREEEEGLADKVGKAIVESMQEMGKSFTMGLGDAFGIKSILGHAMPIFGMGFRSELPNTKRLGVFNAINETLRMIYVHNRFSSKEINELILQQS